MTGVSVRVENARRNELQCEGFTVDDDSVTGVVAALVAHGHIHVTRHEVGQLPLTFVTPLGSDDHRCGHWAPPSRPRCNRSLVDRNRRPGPRSAQELSRIRSTAPRRIRRWCSGSARGRGGVGGAPLRRSMRAWSSVAASRARASAELSLEPQDLLHALQVDALVGQLLDAAQCAPSRRRRNAATRRSCAAGSRGRRARSCEASGGGHRRSRRRPRSRRRRVVRWRSVMRYLFFQRDGQLLDGRPSVPCSVSWGS